MSQFIQGSFKHTRVKQPNTQYLSVKQEQDIWHSYNSMCSGTFWFGIETVRQSNADSYTGLQMLGGYLPYDTARRLLHHMSEIMSYVTTGNALVPESVRVSLREKMHMYLRVVDALDRLILKTSHIHLEWRLRRLQTQKPVNELILYLNNAKHNLRQLMERAIQYDFPVSHSHTDSENELQIESEHIQTRRWKIATLAQEMQWNRFSSDWSAWFETRFTGSARNIAHHITAFVTVIPKTIVSELTWSLAFPFLFCIIAALCWTYMIRTLRTCIGGGLRLQPNRKHINYYPHTTTPEVVYMISSASDTYSNNKQFITPVHYIQQPCI